MAGQREHAGVVLAAKKRRLVIDGELAAASAEFAQTKTHFAMIAERPAVNGCRLYFNNHRVERWGEFVPQQRFLAQLYIRLNDRAVLRFQKATLSGPTMCRSPVFQLRAESTHVPKRDRRSGCPR